jgi:peptidoglycan/xylan/chitin deacetylase (PgdA/CDA1 family)
MNMVGCKTLIKRGLVRSRLLSAAQRLRAQQVVILRYHSVQDDPSRFAESVGKGIIHSTAEFRGQMAWLSRHYEPVTLDDVASALLRRRPLPRRGVVLTFDDGYADNFAVALPVLEEFRLKAAFYITVDCVEHQQPPWFCRLRHAFAVTTRQTWSDPAGQRVWSLGDGREQRQAFLTASRHCARHAGAAQDAALRAVEVALGVEPFSPDQPLMLSWDQVRQLHRQGYVIGSHTLTHPNLAHIDEADMAREMDLSRARLEDVLGVPVHHFSYPSPILEPHWNEATVACGKDCGYQTAVTCTAGPVRATDPPSSLKRIFAPTRLEDFQWSVQCAFLGRCV